MDRQLETELNALAALRGYPTVQAVLNRTGSNKPERGKVLVFQPKLYWIDKD